MVNMNKPSRATLKADRLAPVPKNADATNGRVEHWPEQARRAS